MRLLYPIFCVDKQTNMISVMKNRELASYERTVFFKKTQDGCIFDSYQKLSVFHP